MRKLLVILLVLVLALGVTPAFAEDDEVLIYMLAMENQYDVWLAIKGGAYARAEEDSNIKLIYQAAPNGEIDVQGQISLVETAINAGADAIIISPNDREALVESVTAAYEAGIKVVLFISGLACDAYEASISYDNYVAAQTLAAEVSKQFEGEEAVQIGFIGSVTGSTTLIDRENGYRDYIAENCPNASFVGEALYSQGDTQKAMNCTYDLLAQYPDIRCIFTVNTTTAEGIGAALLEMDRTDVIVTAFDPSETLLDYLETGVIDAISCVDAANIGYTSVDVAMSLVNGEAIEGLDENNFLNVPSAAVTTENMHTEEMQAVLNPELAEQ